MLKIKKKTILAKIGKNNIFKLISYLDIKSIIELK